MVKNGKTKKKYHKPTKPSGPSNPPPPEEKQPNNAKTLPADLLLEVLYRTPVKSLVRCKCVSKSWLALLQHPVFIRMHINFNTARFNKHLLCNTMCDSSKHSRKLIAYLGVTGPPVPVLHIDTQYTARPNYPRIINFPDFSKDMFLAGSINGIVCLGHYKEMFGRFVALWNPAIKYWNPIALSETRSKYDMLDNMSLGLGFDAVVDDFRIIRIVPVALPPRYEQFRWSRVEIYSANRGVWEDVDKGGVIPFWPKLRHCNFVVKGVPYWVGIDAQPGDLESFTPDQLEILGRIDPYTGLFKNIPYPKHFKNQSTLVHPLNLRNSVAALIQSPGEHPNQMVDLYVRDENTASWTKMYSIGPLGFERMRIPQCFSTGEIVLETWTGNNIHASPNQINYICDPKNSSVLRFNDMDTLNPFWYESFSHVESLVCVNGMVQIGKERRDKTTNPKMKDWTEFLPKDFQSVLHL
ncbi:F-box/LRR-repeat protein At2g43260-like [Apium graveolens]|uniref:F-box/LRR-repeat protein At2g43260-like n=1 Tax=Apium graveolens TaxID=4045 RepID=UPI003D7AADF0